MDIQLSTPHINEQVLVKEGERVSKGQVIAKVSLTGKKKGRYLHFEVRHNNIEIVRIANDASMLNQLHKSIQIPFFLFGSRGIRNY